jgi:protein SCO1/2
VTRRRFALAALAAATLSLAGCDKLFPNARSPFHGVDVTGAPIGGELRLTDHNGRPRSLADFRGKVVVVAFGFTHCPDVCPTTLSDFASALKRLGAERDRVQVLFVTVDPARDTQQLLREYVPAFDPTFLGLRGDAAATEKVTRDFKVYAHKREGKGGADYTVDHTAQSFVFDPQGRVRLVLGYGVEAEKIASDLRLLLNS